MLQVSKLWNARYLFGPNPDALTRSDYIFFWGTKALVTLSIIIKIMVLRQESGSPKKFFWNRLFHLFLTSGLLGLLWSGIRYENIPWLGAHIVILVWWLIAAIWLGFIIVYFFRGHRVKQKTWSEEKIKRKYLP